MKNFKTLVIALVLVVFFVSCEKDETKDNSTTVAVEKTNINSKWIIDNSDEYKSFEFTDEGNYLIVKKNNRSINGQEILFGTYVYTDNSTLVLSDFGTLIISDINDQTINFSIQLIGNSNDTIEFSASAQEEMTSSARTELLCRTWEMVSINGISDIESDEELTVLFSEAGTYFITYPNREANDNPDDNPGGGLAHWMWKNEAETELLYSWHEVPEWDDERFVEITELTSTTLTITEDEEVFVLQPVTNNRSTSINKLNFHHEEFNINGFFGK